MTDKTAAPATQAAAKTETVTLKKAHRHRGERKEAGDTITCRPATAARLKAQGIA